MERQGEPSQEAVLRSLDHELELVRGAVAMVASGGAPRVSIGGLRFGDELLEPARRMASVAGVRIVPLWSADEHGAGLTVERVDVDPA